jgi:hypothetical protein
VSDQRLRSFRANAGEMIRLLVGGQAAATTLDIAHVKSVLGVRIDYDTDELVVDVLEDQSIQGGPNGWRIVLAVVDTVADFGAAAPRGRLVVRWGSRCPLPEVMAHLNNAYVFTEPVYLDQPDDPGEDAPHAEARTRPEEPDDQPGSRRRRRGQGGGQRR